MLEILLSILLACGYSATTTYPWDSACVAIAMKQEKLPCLVS